MVELLSRAIDQALKGEHPAGSYRTKGNLKSECWQMKLESLGSDCYCVCIKVNAIPYVIPYGGKKTDVFSAEDVADLIDCMLLLPKRYWSSLLLRISSAQRRWKIGWRSLLVARSSLRSMSNRIHLVSSLWITSSPPVIQKFPSTRRLGMPDFLNIARLGTRCTL